MENTISNVRVYLKKLSEHVDAVERGEKSPGNLDYMTAVLVDLLFDIGYMPEDF